MWRAWIGFNFSHSLGLLMLAALAVWAGSRANALPVGIMNVVFFFAKATAHAEQQLIMRIALIDGPLRDIQLLGFAALIIAGVSQRFVPQVYGLERRGQDRQNPILWLINGSLILNIVSYVLLLTSQQLYFALGLELAYLLMPGWAILLARQIGVFRKPSQPDRTFKFVRAAYNGWWFPV